MGEAMQETDNEILSVIPPLICNNPREKIEPQQVSVSEVLIKQKRPEFAKESCTAQSDKSVISPVPRYPLSLEWSPSVMLFEVDNSLILQKIRIRNACPRSIYINCCGLSGDVARLGAQWRCYPRTRFLLSPGLTADLFIQATPKENSPVASAQLAIHLAAGHKRDCVVGYFVIPIIVKFKKYINPCLGEVEESNNKSMT